MKKFYKLSTLAAFAVFALVQHADSQVLVTTPTFAITNGITQTLQTLGTVPSAIDCSKQRNIAIKWTVQLGGAGTEVQGLRLQPSVDATLPSAPASSLGFVLAIAANGTTPVIVQTNFDTLGYRYLIPYYMTNGNATYYSTNTIEYLVNSKSD